MSFDFDKLVGYVNGNNSQSSNARGRIGDRIRRVTGTFKDRVSDYVTNLILDNMDYLANVICSNDPYGAANRNENVLRRALEHPKSRKYAKAAKRMRTYVNWNTDLFTEGILDFLAEQGISFNSFQQAWLRREVNNFGLWLYDQPGVRL